MNEDGELYQLEEDFYGDNLNDLTGLKSSSNFDLIYLADTYGIYKGDLKTNVIGNESTLIYGGLTIDEWDKLMQVKKLNTTLIVEYNTLALPTKPITRLYMEEDLPIKWEGWFGRYFDNLQRVPKWVINNYEYHTNKRWEYRGKGIVFISQYDKVVVLDEKDFTDSVLFHLTKEGSIHYPLAKNSEYNRWFEVVTANDHSTIEATFNIHFTEQGLNKLKEKRIPLSFPAMIVDSSTNMYYFAGDFAEEKVDYIAKWSLPASIQNLIAYFKGREAFTWKSYQPIMKQILLEIKNKK